MNKNNFGGVSGDTLVYFKRNNVVECKTMEVIANKLVRGDMSLEDIKVRTVNENKEIVWFEPEGFCVNYNEPLYQVNLQGNRSVTCDANLNMLLESMNSKNITKLSKRSHLLGVNGITGITGLKPDLNSILYGMYLGDGFKTSKRGGFSFTKTDKSDYIRNLLNSLDIDFNETVTGNDCINFYFDRENLIKPDLTDKNQITGLLSGLTSSDGCVRRNEGTKSNLRVEFKNTNFEYGRLFKLACFELGITFNSRIKVRDNDKWNNIMITSTRCNKNSVNVLKQLNLRNKQTELIDSFENDFKEINNTRIQMLDQKNFIKPLGTTGTTYNFVCEGNVIVDEDFILIGDGS